MIKIKPRLLDYIVCPLCGSKLHIRGEESQKDTNEILSGELFCPNKHEFSITNGIPRLIDQGLIDEKQAQTQDSFGYKWKKFEEVSFDPAYLESMFKWHMKRYGWKNEDKLKKTLSKKSRILDAGAGLCRTAAYYSKFTNSEVFGVDIGSSLDVGYGHYAKLPNLHIIQSDLRKLPFNERSFDLILADGVLHHTTSTKESFKYLVNFLRDDGELLAYIYQRKGPIREFCDDYVRENIKSKEECLKFSEAITKFGKALTDLDVEIEVPEDLPIFDIKKGKYNLQRFFYWNIMKCFWDDEMHYKTDELRYENSVCVNFDWYHPKYAHRHTPEEVKQWCKEANLKIVNFDVIENGISLRGIKI